MNLKDTYNFLKESVGKNIKKASDDVMKKSSEEILYPHTFKEMHKLMQDNGIYYCQSEMWHDYWRYIVHKASNFLDLIETYYNQTHDKKLNFLFNEYFPYQEKYYPAEIEKTRELWKPVILGYMQNTQLERSGITICVHRTPSEKAYQECINQGIKTPNPYLQLSFVQKNKDYDNVYLTEGINIKEHTLLSEMLYEAIVKDISMNESVSQNVSQANRKSITDKADDSLTIIPFECPGVAEAVERYFGHPITIEDAKNVTSIDFHLLEGGAISLSEIHRMEEKITSFDDFGKWFPNCIEIGSHAFGFPKLESISLPDKVHIIYTDAFEEAESLKRVIYKGKVYTSKHELFNALIKNDVMIDVFMRMPGMNESFGNNISQGSSKDIIKKADRALKSSAQMKKELALSIIEKGHYHSYYDYYYIDVYKDLSNELVTDKFNAIGSSHFFPKERGFNKVNKICLDRKSYIINKDALGDVNLFCLFSPTQSTGFYDGYKVNWENIPFELQEEIYRSAFNLSESVTHNIKQAKDEDVVKNADEKILPKITKAERFARRLVRWLNKQPQLTKIETQDCLGPEWNQCKRKNHWFYNVMESKMMSDYHYITEILIRHHIKDDNFFTLKVGFNSNPDAVKDNSIVIMEVWFYINNSYTNFRVPIVNGEYAYPSSIYYEEPYSTPDNKTLKKLEDLITKLTSIYDGENYVACLDKVKRSNNRNDVFTGRKNGFINYLYNTSKKKYIG